MKKSCKVPSNNLFSSSSLILEDFSNTKKIGQGSFGEIYEVSLKNKENMKYAAKICCSKEIIEKTTELSKENAILQKMSLSKGFPKVSDFIKKGENEILLMTLLGKNLNEISNEFGGKFSLKTTLMIAMQAIRRLEALHEKGYLHRDVKPANFVLGLGEEKNTLYLIDFGLSTTFLKKDGKHIEFNKNSSIGGTIYYLSVYGHLGLQPSRRDDLISLGFMLLHLYFGCLPWDEVKGNLKQKLKGICEKKATTTSEELCKGLPEQFVTYFEYLKAMMFQMKPDYNYLVDLFEKAMVKEGFKNDGVFDWCEPESSKGIDLNGRKLSDENLTKFMKKLEESDGDLP